MTSYLPEGARDAYVTSNGIRLYCVHQGTGPLVLLCHGFPEIWYSWRHQLGPIADAGYRAVAVDLPGYGRSDKPDRSYDMAFVNACLADLIPRLGHDRAVMVGHDWGGLLVWQFARRYPDLTAGVIGVNTPDLPRSGLPPIELMRKAFPDQPPYMVQFQDPGVAEWVFSWGRGAPDFLRMIFGGPATVNADAFTDDVLAVYEDAYRPYGALTAPIDYYRNLDTSWHQNADVADTTIDVPCLMICAEGDPVLTPAMSAGMEQRVPHLDRVLIERCGHWTQQERPNETNGAILSYLAKLLPWS